MNLKELILAAPDLKRETVEVPEWETSVTVSEFTAYDGETLHEFTTVAGDEGKRTIDNGSFNAKVAVRGIIDAETGARVFEDADYPLLAKKNGKALKRIADAIIRLNGMGADAINDAVKNSEPEEKGDSLGN